MTRTCDLLVRSQTLYPTELRALISNQSCWSIWLWTLDIRLNSRAAHETKPNTRMDRLADFWKTVLARAGLVNHSICGVDTVLDFLLGHAFLND
jgi:hypothetical protein